MTTLYPGLDVHKDSVVVAIAASDGSEPLSYGKWGGSNLSVERGLAKLCKSFKVSKENLSIAYEAGPTGFVLARRLIQLGYRCRVVAPSMIPSLPGDRVKTDKRDAKKLAGLLRAGQLTACHIPEPKDEAIRDICGPERMPLRLWPPQSNSLECSFCETESDIRVIQNGHIPT